MLKSFSEKFYKQIVDVSPRRVIYSDEQRDQILFDARRVRSKDYVLDFDIIDGQIHTRGVTTTANWYFILTGAAVFFDGVNSFDLPKVGIKFQDFTPSSPFGTVPEDLGCVNACLSFGREGLPFGRWEEFKNLYFSLAQRITVNVEVLPNNSEPLRGNVLLTGLEFNLYNETGE